MADSNIDYGPLNGSDSVDVTIIADGDGPSYDAETNTTHIPLDDGSVEISFGPPPRRRADAGQFDENLAEVIPDSVLGTMADRLLTAIDKDDQSRKGWLENMKNGINLLGLEVKVPRSAAAEGTTPAEGTSTVDHPGLLEAVLRFQANARGELLPTDGPVKVRNDGEGTELANSLAQALEKDLNHYLTKVATEYVPDTDRMLLKLGFSGIAFKKGLHDPIKRRPVIVSIEAEDLIVSNATTDLASAGRVTHRFRMRPSLMRRMQLVGAYRDIHLPATGMPRTTDVVEEKIQQVQGIAPATYTEPEDEDRELFECYCEYDIPGFEHCFKDPDTGEETDTGLPLPYKVTIDKNARQILEIRRNWEEDDPFCMARSRIVAYVFIPGFGFYGIGLLNVLGNATKALTAAWRLLLDAGMFSNFPGFLYLKALGKQLTNQFRVPPGSGMPVDVTGVQDIRSAIMPLPYKDPSAVFIQLIDNIATTSQRVGGTAELQIGEGKQDAPVGTTLALIEQATKLMSAVHKRCHTSQGLEFDMLKDLLMEDPEALWRHNKKSAVLKILTAQAGQQPLVDAEKTAEQRHRALFLAALSDCELIPRADPNTSSQTERYLKAQAMRMMATTNPGIDMNKVDARVFRVIGIDDGDSLFKPPPPGPPGPSPEEVMAQATAQTAQSRLLDSQTKARTAAATAANETAKLASTERIAHLNLARELVIHRGDQEAAAQQQRDQSADAAADRIHALALAHLKNRSAERARTVGLAHEHFQGTLGRQHEAAEAGRDRMHAAGVAAMGHAHDANEAALDRQHEIDTQPAAEGVAPQ